MSGVESSTARRLLLAYAALAATAPPMAAGLAERWGLAAAGLAGFLGAAGLVGAGVAALLTGLGAPTAQSMRAALSPLGGALTALILATVSPSFGAAFVFTAAAFACAIPVTAAMFALYPSVPSAVPQRRAMMFPLAAGIGGAGGLLLLAGVQPTEALDTVGVLAAPGAVAVVALHAAGRSVEVDAEATGAPKGNALLCCLDLRLSYDGQRALDGIDLTIAPGELVALVGTNGAGKTTLLRAIAGLAAPATGRIYLDGRAITRLPPERRRQLGIALMAGHDGLFDSLTVGESLALAAGARHVRDHGADAVERLMARLPRLSARRGALVGLLSGGERQLLALAQALLCQPRLLLLDDLSAGLGRDGLSQAVGLVREVHDHGTAVLLVEQSLELALGLAQRVCFMEGGRLRFDGSPNELRERRDLLRPIYVPTAATGT